MYHPSKQVECCEGTLRISGREAKGPDEGQPAIGAMRLAIAFLRSHGGREWPFWLFHSENEH
jgi:hypothetical protein